MAVIERKRYLEMLAKRRDNGRVKIVTGIRRCGKSVFLDTIYRDRLIRDGVAKEQIILLDLDDYHNARYRNPVELDDYLRGMVKNEDQRYYILIDDIHRVKPAPDPSRPDKAIRFTDVLSGLGRLPNVDVCATVSNSKTLSCDIATNLRCDIIPLTPLTYEEFHAAYPGDKSLAWREYSTYGGMPEVLAIESHEDKAHYLADLFRLIYITDVIERNHLKVDEEVLDQLLYMISSSVGSLTNPTQLANKFKSANTLKIKNETISRYLDCFIETFVIHKSLRYDINGRTYIETPQKYYFSDIGLRNVKTNFCQGEEGPIIENILHNELKARGFNIDVGVVPIRWKDEDGKARRSMLEVDFVLSKGKKRCYIQSASTVAEKETRQQVSAPLCHIDDTFPKIVITQDKKRIRTDNRGIRYLNIEDFLSGKINNL